MREWSSSSKLTPAQYEMLNRIKKMQNSGRRPSCVRLHTSFYKEECKSRSLVSAMIQKLKNKNFVQVTRYVRDIDGSLLTAAVDLLDKGDRALKQYEKDGQQIDRVKLRRIGACDSCGKHSRLVYFRSSYLCSSCLNPDIKGGYVLRSMSSIALCEDV